MLATRIISKAYHTVINHPVLWAFGLFLTSGFNIHWVWLHQRAPRVGEYPLQWTELLAGHPGRLVALLGGGLAAFIIGIVVNSIAKTLLVLHVSHFLGIKRVHPGLRRADDAVTSEPLYANTKAGMHMALVRETPRYLPSVIAIALTTTVLTVLGAVVLFVPPLKLVSSGELQASFVLLASAIFLFLVFVISCLNVFASFFVILYQRGYKSAINLATDLMLTKWQTVLGFVLLLMTLYAFSLAAATGLLFVSQHLVVVELGWLGGLRSVFTGLGAAITWVLVSLALLVWLGVLNSFFNTALLLLFTELVKPEEQALLNTQIKAALPHSKA